MKVAIFQFSFFGINTYVVYDSPSGKCAVIDPGMIDQREYDAITDFIRNHNLCVTHVINTHLHLDHAVGDDFIRTKFNVPILAGKPDEPLGKNLSRQAMMFGISQDFKGVEISQYIEDGEVIKIGDEELNVIAVPGHSPGSVALYDQKDGFLISGDALFRHSIGRTDLPGGNHPELLKSIKEKILTLPADTVVYPGHGPATTIGEEKQMNPFL